MTTAVRPSFREVLDPADPALVAAHRLLQRTFHKSELVPRTEWRNLLREREAGLWFDTRWHLIVAELAGEVIGVASGTYLGNVNTGAVGYLAVSETARGLGLGPRLRARLRTLLTRDALKIAREPLEAIIGEVRSDNPWLHTLVRRDRVLALDFAYYQPHLHEDSRPVPLVLYYEPLGKDRRRLSVLLVRKLLYTTFRRIYRIARPMSNPAFRRMMAELAGRKFVGKLTPGDLPAFTARFDR
jgi:GNAT superfamily N-acetyltransferase